MNEMVHLQGSICCQASLVGLVTTKLLDMYLLMSYKDLVSHSLIDNFIKESDSLVLNSCFVSFIIDCNDKAIKN